MRKDEEKKYCIGIKEADEAVLSLCSKFSSSENREFIRQMLTTVIKLHLDRADTGNLKLINTTLKELRHAFRVFKHYRDKRKVVIFGSHRIPPGSAAYKMAVEFARKIDQKGFMVITGGGGGIMAAGNLGAGDKSFAVKIRIPQEKVNPFVARSEKLININYFFNRKLVFIKESDATVLFPGGFGTLDEGFEVLTLLQTGKTEPRPVVMIEPPGMNYWKPWLKFIKDGMLKNHTIQKHDLELFTIVNSVDQAVIEICDFYRIYHSLRFVEDLAIIRLNHELSDKNLIKLNREFKDILIKGAIKKTPPLPAEIRNREFLDKPRICLYADVQKYNQLIVLIKKINTLA